MMATILLAFWTDRFFQRECKSMILEQSFTMFFRLAFKVEKRHIDKKARGLCIERVNCVQDCQIHTKQQTVLHKINQRLLVFYLPAGQENSASRTSPRCTERQSQRCKCDSCIWHVLSLEFVKVVRGGTWAPPVMGLCLCVWIVCKTPQRAPTAVFLIADENEVPAVQAERGGRRRRAPMNVSIISICTVLSSRWQMTCVRCYALESINVPLWRNSTLFSYEI